ncbi:hypothetical protein BT96DRAFT_1018339 [Gymnopus androsaceus JB14]|uniref:Uncharacterized protein n=1 Tax=Gymnopus androsaceus JB14 TaxID=1447944 RepID=A0A6A4HV70_9AGAR|nr:hypothetical protein BT96DRAFT_1018339 [Gymnopus androsaceus JB14]
MSVSHPKCLSSCVSIRRYPSPTFAPLPPVASTTTIFRRSYTGVAISIVERFCFVDGAFTQLSLPALHLTSSDSSHSSFYASVTAPCSNPRFILLEIACGFTSCTSEWIIVIGSAKVSFSFLHPAPRRQKAHSTALPFCASESVYHLAWLWGTLGVCESWLFCWWRLLMGGGHACGRVASRVENGSCRGSLWEPWGTEDIAGASAFSSDAANVNGQVPALIFRAGSGAGSTKTTATATITTIISYSNCAIVGTAGGPSLLA